MSEQVSKNHYVFSQEKTICNRGRARYKLESARVEKFPVAEDFANAVCLLPNVYDEAPYKKFIDDWGTVSLLDVVFIISFTCS